MKKLLFLSSVLVLSCYGSSIFAVATEEEKEAFVNIIKEKATTFKDAKDAEQLKKAIENYITETDKKITAKINKLYKNLIIVSGFKKDDAIIRYNILRNNLSDLAKTLESSATSQEAKAIIKKIISETALTIQSCEKLIKDIKRSGKKQTRFAAEIILQYAKNLITAIANTNTLNESTNKRFPPTPPSSRDLDEETQQVGTELGQIIASDLTKNYTEIEKLEKEERNSIAHIQNIKETMKKATNATEREIARKSIQNQEKILAKIQILLKNMRS